MISNCVLIYGIISSLLSLSVTSVVTSKKHVESSFQKYQNLWADWLSYLRRVQVPAPSFTKICEPIVWNATCNLTACLNCLCLRSLFISHNMVLWHHTFLLYASSECCILVLFKTPVLNEVSLEKWTGFHLNFAREFFILLIQLLKAFTRGISCTKDVFQTPDWEWKCEYHTVKKRRFHFSDRGWFFSDFHIEHKCINWSQWLCGSLSVGQMRNYLKELRILP